MISRSLNVPASPAGHEEDCVAIRVGHQDCLVLRALPADGLYDLLGLQRRPEEPPIHRPSRLTDLESFQW